MYNKKYKYSNFFHIKRYLLIKNIIDMNKVIRLNENDIENLVKKIIKEEEMSKTEKNISILQAKHGELSSIDGIIKMIKQAKDAYEDLVNTKITGENGYSKEIDGIVNDFTKLEDKVRKSKENISKFVAQKSEKEKVDHMRHKKMDYMRKRQDAEKNGRFYA
jgi:hypothetical protein